MEERNRIKKQIRKTILAQRDALSKEHREQAGALLTERICNHQWFVSADILLGFVSYGSEIDTTGILSEALQMGKQVYVPKVEGDVMNFYRILSLEELVEGYKGIREPRGDGDSFCYQPGETGKCLMLMPGVAFDEERNRMGYGKGFYDRFLADKQELQLRTIGVCYGCQRVEQLPAEKWDIKPMEVISV